MEHFNIVNLFFESAGKYPDKTAIICKGESITFSSLEQQVKDTSSYFISKGIAKGDRVMVFVPMGFDLYRTVLALFNIGATAVFLDEWVNKKRMEACCEVAQCKAMIGIPKARVFAFFSSGLRKIPIKLGTCYKVMDVKPGENHQTVSSDTALISFTTGSTGTPKAAKRTHGFLHEQFKALIEIIDPQPGDVDMPVLPIVLLINLGAGCTSVITDFKASKPESMNASAIVTLIKQHKVNRMVSSPFFVKELAKYVIKNKVYLPSLQKVFTGGAPVFPSEAALYTTAFPNSKTEIVYGSTEAEPISSIDAKVLSMEIKHILQKGLKAGTAHASTEVRIMKIQDGEITCKDEAEFEEWLLPDRRIGEIVVSGPHVLREYFNNQMALKTNKIFVGDKCWHRTGDSGYLDENNVVFLTGRCNTLIYSDDRLIAPFIYENYYQSIEGIEMGTLLEINGTITAIIEMKSGANKKSVIEKIHHTKLKPEIIFIAKIPRDPRHNSKIDYDKLRKSF